MTMAHIASCVLVIALLASGMAFSTKKRHEQFPGLNASATTALYHRVLGSALSNTNLEFVQTGFDRDAAGRPLDQYEFVLIDNSLIVAASSGIAAARALGDYLHAMGCDIDRPGKQLGCLEASDSLPGAPMNMSRSSRHSIRYNYNVVAHSYSMPFWDVQDWVQELDVIALQGYNAPVLFQGQEYVWAEVFTSLGIAPDDLDDFFAGPAFLAWSGPRMGNMRRWMGPLDAPFRLWQAQMAKVVLNHARSLGFLPIMPAFAGHVPLALAGVFPDANITRSPYWAGMPEEYTQDGFLEPTDPLFDQIQRSFLRIYNATMGGLGAPDTPHLFNADSYNEMLPQSNDTQFLASVAGKTFDSIATIDPDAVWVIQGWAFSFEPAFWQAAQIKAFVTGVPQGRMLVLDLAAFKYPIWKQTEGFFGQDFVWCVLNNGGGRVGMFGNLTHVVASVQNVTAFGSGLAGLGSSPEGIHDNPVMYRLLADLSWTSIQPTASSIGSWLVDYVVPRYGLDDTDVPASSKVALLQGWSRLHTAVYNYTVQHDTAAWMFRPGLNMRTLGYWYDSQALTDAWRCFAKAAGMGSNDFNSQWWLTRPMLVRDLVDVTRQEATTWFEDVYEMMMAAYRENRTSSTRSLGSELVQHLDDIDHVLEGSAEFMVGPWIQAANSTAASVSRLAGDGPDSTEALARRDAFVTNAKWLITLWGPVEGNGAVLQSYAQRQWGGIAGSLYLQSWANFTARLTAANVRKTALNESEWSQQAIQAEFDWATNSSAQFNTSPSSAGLLASLESLWARMAGDGGETSLSNFRQWNNSDGYGDLLHVQLQSRDHGQLATLALLDSQYTGGFNANGWIKTFNAYVVPYNGSTYWQRK